MNFLEKDLEEIIFNADRELLEERGLLIEGTLKRQLRIGNYGIADLVTFNRGFDNDIYFTQGEIYPYLVVTVYELKQEKIGISAFLQAVGYVNGIKNYIQYRKNIEIDVVYKIVLIGKSIDKNSTFIYLPELIPQGIDHANFLECYTYSYELDGIHFKDISGYKLTDEGW